MLVLRQMAFMLLQIQAPRQISMLIVTKLVKVVGGCCFFPTTTLVGRTMLFCLGLYHQVQHRQDQMATATSTWPMLDTWKKTLIKCGFIVRRPLIPGKSISLPTTQLSKPLLFQAVVLVAQKQLGTPAIQFFLMVVMVPQPISQVKQTVWITVVMLDLRNFLSLHGTTITGLSVPLTALNVMIGCNRTVTVTAHDTMSGCAMFLRDGERGNCCQPTPVRTTAATTTHTLLCSHASAFSSL